MQALWTVFDIWYMVSECQQFLSSLFFGRCVMILWEYGHNSKVNLPPLLVFWETCFSSLDNDVHVNKIAAPLTCYLICNGLLILLKHISIQLEIIFLERKIKYQKNKGIGPAASIAPKAFLDALDMFCTSLNSFRYNFYHSLSVFLRTSFDHGSCKTWADDQRVSYATRLTHLVWLTFLPHLNHVWCSNSAFISALFFLEFWLWEKPLF